MAQQAGGAATQAAADAIGKQAMDDLGKGAKPEEVVDGLMDKAVMFDKAQEDARGAIDALTGSGGSTPTSPPTPSPTSSPPKQPPAR
jgi:hypothetical protein